LYGKPELTKVITISWPDGDTSRYTEVDSMELLNLAEAVGGNYSLAQPEDIMEQDWSRGYVIKKDGREHIRLW
jgi:hypothetical protein